MISVIMPCYNAGRFIERTIQSVQRQTYQDWELLVVDDGSTDNSVEIVSRLAKDDSRIRLIKQLNAGACRARNNGIDNAKGEYVKFLDADDILVPNALLEQIKQMVTLKLNQIPFGDYGFIDENDNVIGEHQFAESMELLKTDQVAYFFKEWQVLITCPLHRTEFLRKINGFDERLPRGQETDLHLRLAAHDVEFVYMPTKQFYYRQYQAEQRISCNFKEKSRAKIISREIRCELVEEIFKEKYGQIPSRYFSFFRNGYFDKARRLFAEKQLEDGRKYLDRSAKYKPHTSFQRMYIFFGKIFGYVFEESVLQLRLKILGK